MRWSVCNHKQQISVSLSWGQEKDSTLNLRIVSKFSIHAPEFILDSKIKIRPASFSLPASMSSGSAPKSANGSRSRAPLRDVTDVANSIAGSTSWLQETSSRVFKWVSENPAPAAGAVAGVVGAALVAAYFSKPSSGEQKERPTASPMRQGAAGRSGRLALLQLDEYERSIRKDIILPHQIEEGFADIGGLEDIVRPGFERLSQNQCDTHALFRRLSALKTLSSFLSLNHICFRKASLLTGLRVCFCTGHRGQGKLS